MIKGDDDAYAFPTTDLQGESIAGPGLTKLEWFAGMALIGLLANGKSGPSDRQMDNFDYQSAATNAFLLADAMVKESREGLA